MKREAMNAEMVSRGDAEKVGGGGAPSAIPPIIPLRVLRLTHHGRK